MTYQDIVNEHIKKFGVEPVVTGANCWDDTPLDIRVLKAIESGQPYVEDTVPEDELV